MFCAESTGETEGVIFGVSAKWNAGEIRVICHTAMLWSTFQMQPSVFSFWLLRQHTYTQRVIRQAAKWHKQQQDLHHHTLK